MQLVAKVVDVVLYLVCCILKSQSTIYTTTRTTLTYILCKIYHESYEVWLIDAYCLGNKVCIPWNSNIEEWTAVIRLMLYFSEPNYDLQQQQQHSTYNLYEGAGCGAGVARGEGEGAGDSDEELAGESDCSEPVDWCWGPRLEWGEVLVTSVVFLLA